MRVLVIGSGGREHALCWKFKTSRRVTALYCIPGNAGIQQVAECPQIELQANGGFRVLLDWIEKHEIHLTFVGPEAPLADGLVDDFEKHFANRPAFRILGPPKACARLESSKVFAKEFMQECHIPTPKAHVVSDERSARRACEQLGFPQNGVVLKADGLAAGKGVWVCTKTIELEEALVAFFRENRYGLAGQKVLVEECLYGEEVSFMALCDGETAVPFPASQDHKRLLDQDQGPNTGGMGAYSPVSAFSPALEKSVMDLVIQPTLEGMKKRGTPYRGILYAGLMLTKDGPKVLEFNCRFGDPEAQVLLTRLKGDLGDLVELAVKGDLKKLTPLELASLWDERASVCVVMTSGGYPNSFEKGYKIEGLREVEKTSDIQNGEVFVFHAGTSLREGQFMTAGGRVLGVTALGATLQKAVEKAYRTVDQIRWSKEHHRRDIARKGM